MKSIWVEYIHCLNNQTEPNCAKPKPNRLPIYGFEDTLNYYVHLLLTKYFLAKNQIMCRRQMIFFQSSFFPLTSYLVGTHICLLLKGKNVINKSEFRRK